MVALMSFCWLTGSQDKRGSKFILFCSCINKSYDTSFVFDKACHENIKYNSYTLRQKKGEKNCGQINDEKILI